MSNEDLHILKNPLYVFNLPRVLLSTLQLRELSSAEPNSGSRSEPEPSHRESPPDDDTLKSPTSCTLCQTNFYTVENQRQHVKSDWHRFNLKRRLHRGDSIDELTFGKLISELDESISGSDFSQSESEDGDDSRSDVLSSLLKREAKAHGDQEPYEPPHGGKVRIGRQPLIWFSTSLLPPTTLLGTYRALFTAEAERNGAFIEALVKEQLGSIQDQTSPNKNDSSTTVPTSSDPCMFLCMTGGGHFAAMIVSLVPKVGKNGSGKEEHQTTVIAHKTFHRYTTRRKQGGSQSANDSAKGAASSAGASIRRYNEAALEAEIRALLVDWRSMIASCKLLFVRATGNTNRRTLYGPQNDQVLHIKDHRIRSFPFNTRRATQAELLRAFLELTRMKTSQENEIAVEIKVPTQPIAKTEVPHPILNVEPSKPSKEEEEAFFHTSQLQALVRRSKAPAILQYLSKNSLSPNLVFQPTGTQANHHAPTLLHLASGNSCASVVSSLLMRGGADPTVVNGEGKVPYDLAGDAATRDVFRIARFELGDSKWDWSKARCPSPMSRAEVDERESLDRKRLDDIEMVRREAEMERLNLSQGHDEVSGQKDTKTHPGTLDVTTAERREQEARGLTPEVRMKLERERRARAAEARFHRPSAH